MPQNLHFQASFLYSFTLLVDGSLSFTAMANIEVLDTFHFYWLSFETMVAYKKVFSGLLKKGMKLGGKIAL